MLKTNDPRRTLVHWTAVAVICEVLAGIFVPKIGAACPLLVATVGFALGGLGNRYLKHPELVVLVLAGVATAASLLWLGVLSALVVAVASYMFGACSLLQGGALRAYVKRRARYG